MEAKFCIIVETGKGRAVYPAQDLGEAVEIYREQLETYPESQIHLLRDMPAAAARVNAAEKGGMAEAVGRDAERRQKVEKHAQIDSRFLKKQTEGADPDNPLYEKVVVMSGTYEQIGMTREQVAESIQRLGAKLNRGIGPTVNVFVTGNKPGPSKLKEVEQMRASGREVRILSQLELKEIIDRYL